MKLVGDSKLIAEAYEKIEKKYIKEFTEINPPLEIPELQTQQKGQRFSNRLKTNLPATRTVNQTQKDVIYLIDLDTTHELEEHTVGSLQYYLSLSGRSIENCTGMTVPEVLSALNEGFVIFRVPNDHSILLSKSVEKIMNAYRIIGGINNEKDNAWMRENVIM